MPDNNNNLDPGVKLFHDIPAEMMIEMLRKNSSLRGYLQGYAAEEYLMKKLRSMDGIDEVSKIPDRDKQKGDISLSYQGRPLTIEIKSLKSGSSREDFLEGGFSATVLVKRTDRAQDEGDQVGTTHLTPGEFDILAISTYGITGRWEYYYIANKYLPRAAHDTNKIHTNPRINVLSTPFLHSDLLKAIADLS